MPGAERRRKKKVAWRGAPEKKFLGGMARSAGGNIFRWHGAGRRSLDLPAPHLTTAVLFAEQQKNKKQKGANQEASRFFTALFRNCPARKIRNSEQTLDRAPENKKFWTLAESSISYIPFGV